MKIFQVVESFKERVSKKGSMLRSKNGINMLSSSSAKGMGAKRPMSLAGDKGGWERNDRRSINKITDNLLSGIGIVGKQKGLGLGMSGGIERMRKDNE